ncbi:hypothetical protein [Streptomyces zaomyceticus]|uniref:Uncharacterized protein n=1 Tax=Streptomyces zaomyceticus TaxID=68286 RepID=A0ABZ1LMX2_9ACTN|nr:hypothetical protein OG237_42395 [Streptomyces zaomyceticus]
MPAIRLTSFGYLHLPTGPDGQPIPPAADRIEDVRDQRRDPPAAHDILDLDGLNPRVQDVVLNTPGARELLANLADYADLPAGPAASPSAVRAGSTGQPASPNSSPENSAPAAARSTSSTSASISPASSSSPGPGPE